MKIFEVAVIMIVIIVIVEMFAFAIKTSEERMKDTSENAYYVVYKSPSGQEVRSYKSHSVVTLIDKDGNVEQIAGK